MTSFIKPKSFKQTLTPLKNNLDDHSNKPPRAKKMTLEDQLKKLALNNLKQSQQAPSPDKTFDVEPFTQRAGDVTNSGEDINK